MSNFKQQRSAKFTLAGLVAATMLAFAPNLWAGGDVVHWWVGDAESKALKVIVDEKLSERSHELGSWFMAQLRDLDSPHVEEVRGQGLMVGVVIKESSGTARPFCEALHARGILAKETHHQVIRFAPPLTISREDLEFALKQAREVLA